LDEPALPKHYQRNFWSFALDFGFFGLGMAFVSVNTVIPSFLTALGTSSAFIGLISSLQSASWLLPQLLAARYLADKPRQKPYIIWPAGAGRSLLLLLAIVVWATGATPTWLVMLAVLLVVVGFWVADGLGSVAWFDVMSNVIPPRRRGRLVGTGQVMSGSLGFLAGFVVEWLLSDRGPAFPTNYALLFLIGFLMLALSLLSISFLVEERRSATRKVPSWREYLPQLAAVFKQDAVFRRLILARQLSGLSSLAIPFYMPYALESLGLPSQVAGRYTSIGVVGSILAALTFGWLNERYGSKRVILTSLTLGLLVPLMALLLPMLLTESTVLAWGYGLVFFFLSALMSSMMPGWMTYVLEWAPASQRPTYVGLTNTLNGITSLFATLGGLILQWSGNNYRLLFVLTGLGLLMAWPLPLSLPEPRQRASSQQDE
jgi:MFS family permease